MRRYQQKGISFVVKYLICYVFAVIGLLYREVVDGRYISLGCLNCLAVDEFPCRIGIILCRKFLTLSVLLQYESGFKLRLFRIGWNFHAFLDVRSDMIGPEIKQRQIV